MSDRAALSHEELAELVPIHALGALDADDAAAVEAHLATCPTCSAAFAEALQTVSALALATDDVGPPPALRERILTAARAEAPPAAPVPRAAEPVAAPASLDAARARRRRRLSPARSLAIAFAVAAAALAVLALDQRSQLDDLRGRSGASEAVAALGGDARSVALEAADGTRVGTVVVGTDGSALLVTDLAPAASGRAYQAWSITGSGAPVSLGLVGPGTTALPKVAGADVVAITEEPAGGSEQPTTAPLAAATL